MKVDYNKRCQEAISVAISLNYAIYELEEAKCRADITRVLGLIPNKVSGKISREYCAFCVNDMTRTEFIKVLKHQLKLRKRAVARYIKITDGS